MKAWLGFGRTLYVFDPTVLAEMLRRVQEIDEYAKVGGMFGGKPTITLAASLSVATRTAINNEVFTVNGIHRPTAEEIEADAIRKPVEATHTEPDGALGYEYTAECRTGVRVGKDWLQIAAQAAQKPEIKALQVISLYHHTMTANERKAA